MNPFLFLADGRTSYEVPAPRGPAVVLQGSPLLFSLFINDIPRSPQTAADRDTTVYYSSRNKSLITRKLQSAAVTLE